MANGATVRSLAPTTAATAASPVAEQTLRKSNNSSPQGLALQRAPALVKLSTSTEVPVATMGGSEPLRPEVQAPIENSLQVNLESVKVHTDASAQAANESLGARAFAFGSGIFLGRGERPTDLGLMAHEAAHVVQQQSAPTVQRMGPLGGDSFEGEAHRASAAVVRGESFQVRERTSQPRVQRLGISDVLDYFADKANNIPGFRMFTIILGVNPINWSKVDRSAANILRAVVEFIPGGHLITQALDNYGIFEKAGKWVEEQIHTLGEIGGSIKKAIGDFIDSLGWRDIFHLGDVWSRAKRIFTDPIDRIISFVKGLITGFLGLIRDALLRPLAKLAEGTAGWDLLKAVLGQDPITGDPVPQTAETLIGGFMKLIGQEEIWNNIKKANALSRAWAWFKGALAGLLGFVKQIPSLIIQTIRSIELMDIVLIWRVFIKVGKAFGGFLLKFFSWAGETIWSLLQIIFEVVAPGAVPYLKKVGAAFKKILKNPIAFVGNLVKAGKLGFQNFASNIGTHLKAAFIEWLTGSLPGVYLPKSFDLKEIVKFVFSVLGLTWENIRQKLVKAIGEPAVKALEIGFDIVVTLVKEGPAAAWDKIKDQLANLKDMVMSAIVDYIVVTVVRKAVEKVLSLLIPGAAFIQAIIAIYDTIMVFIEKLKKIIQVVTAFLDSIVAIANGVIGAAAAKVESTLAGLLVLAISFLAGFLSLGKIADKVMNIINTKVRAPIDKAIDFLITWIVTMAKKVGKFLGSKARALWSWAAVKSNFADGEGESHTIYAQESGGKVRLLVASSPMAVAEFLEWYLGKRDALRETKKGLIADVRAKIGPAQALMDQIAAAEKAKPDDPKLQTLQQDLLNKNVEISGLLASLVGKDESIGKAKEKYKLEGLTGTYSSIPKPPGDDFTADHQPQAAILQAAAEFDYFRDEGELVKRAKGRAKEGFAINLHKIRHILGRTFGSKGKKTKGAFLTEIERDTKSVKSAPAKRRIVVAKIKSDMMEDVKAMRSVAGADAKSANWADIAGPKAKGTKEEKEALVTEVRERILSGESQIASQDIDSLVE